MKSSEDNALNIVVLTRSTYFHKKGFFENYLKALYEYLGKQGHYIKIITTAHPEGIKTFKDKHLEYFFLEKSPPGKYSQQWNTQSRAFVLDLLKTTPVDVIHCQSLSGYSLLEDKPDILCPIILSRQRNFYEDFIKFRTRIFGAIKFWGLTKIGVRYFHFLRMYRRWEKPCFKYADHVIAISESQAQILQRHYGVPESKLTVIPNPIMKRMDSLTLNPETVAGVGEALLALYKKAVL